MIVKTPELCGGRATIYGTELPVSLLIKLRKNGALNDCPQITKQMMNEAIKYYSNNIKEIEAEIVADNDL